jgi:hypothetical protein
MNKLSSATIVQLAAQEGVRSFAVENFLATLEESTREEALANLDTDAKLYKWNAPTVNAIRRGITLAFKG